MRPESSPLPGSVSEEHCGLQRGHPAPVVIQSQGPILGLAPCSISGAGTLLLFPSVCFTMVVPLLKLGNPLCSYLVDLSEGEQLDVRITQIQFQLY